MIIHHSFLFTTLVKAAKDAPTPDITTPPGSFLKTRGVQPLSYTLPYTHLTQCGGSAGLLEGTQQTLPTTFKTGVKSTCVFQLQVPCESEF